MCSVLCMVSNNKSGAITCRFSSSYFWAQRKIRRRRSKHLTGWEKKWASHTNLSECNITSWHVLDIRLPVHVGSNRTTRECTEGKMEKTLFGNGHFEVREREPKMTVVFWWIVSLCLQIMVEIRVEQLVMWIGRIGSFQRGSFANHVNTFPIMFFFHLIICVWSLVLIFKIFFKYKKIPVFNLFYMIYAPQKIRW